MPTHEEELTVREARVLALGNNGSGKSALMHRLAGAPFTPTDATHGHITQMVGIRDDAGPELELSLWDFGYTRLPSAALRAFLSAQSVYLVAWSAEREDTRSIEHWTRLIRSSAPHAPIIGVACRADMMPPPSPDELRGRHPGFADCVVVSALKGSGLPELLRAISRAARTLPSFERRVPIAFQRVRRRIRIASIETSGASILSYDQYLEVCREEGVGPQDAEWMSSLLQDLGVMFYAKEDSILRHTIIMRPQLILDVAQKIADDALVQAHKGYFRLSDLPRILSDPSDLAVDVPEPNYVDMLQAMSLLGVCVPLGWQDEYLMVPRTVSDTGEAEWSEWPNPAFRFEYREVPGALMPHVIGASFSSIDDTQLRTDAAILMRDGAPEILVRQDSDRAILVHTREPRPWQLTMMVRRTIRGINRIFPASEARELVCIECDYCHSSFTAGQGIRERVTLAKEKAKSSLLCPHCGAQLLLARVREQLGDSDDPEPATMPEELVRVFVASSRELRRERDLVQRLIDRENRELRWPSCLVEPVIWERLIAQNAKAAQDERSMQDYFNREIRKCPIALCLFHRHLGVFTREEFDLAMCLNRQGADPRYLLAFFKNDGAEESPAIREVREQAQQSPGVTSRSFATNTELVAHLETAMHVAVRGVIRERGLSL